MRVVVPPSQRTGRAYRFGACHRSTWVARGQAARDSAGRPRHEHVPWPRWMGWLRRGCEWAVRTNGRTVNESSVQQCVFISLVFVCICVFAKWWKMKQAATEDTQGTLKPSSHLHSRQQKAPHGQIKSATVLAAIADSLDRGFPPSGTRSARCTRPVLQRVGAAVVHVRRVRGAVHGVHLVAYRHNVVTPAAHRERGARPLQDAHIGCCADVQ